MDKILKSLYRARTFQSPDKLKAALMRPDREIAPPTSALATAGRMNARGISVFYGATKPETARAELRPPVGSDVVIGRFDLVKDVRLLDIDALASVKVEGSVFDPAFLPKLERVKFLHSLSRRITRPVMPDDEVFEYLVTQAIADFLATELKFDGVIYRSAQNQGGKNVALFHHAAKVVTSEPAEGTELSVHRDVRDADDTIRRFMVDEAFPKPKPPTEKPHDPMLWLAPFHPEAIVEPVLKLDFESLCVHKITAVAYSADEATVARFRHPKYEPPA